MPIYQDNLTDWMINQQDYQAELEVIKEAEENLFLASLKGQDKTLNSLLSISKK